MRNKILKFFFVFALLFGFTFALASCKKEEAKTDTTTDTDTGTDKENEKEDSGSESTTTTTTLTIPTVTTSGQTVTWEAVPNATAYVVNVNGTDMEAQTTTSYTLEDVATGDYTIKVKAITTTSGYTNSEYSLVKTVTVTNVLSELPEGFYESLLTEKDTITISFADVQLSILNKIIQFDNDSFVKATFKDGQLLANGTLNGKSIYKSGTSYTKHSFSFTIDEDGALINTFNEKVYDLEKLEAGNKYDSEYDNHIQYYNVALTLEELYTMINDAVAQVLPDTGFDINNVTSVNSLLTELGIEGITLPELPTVTKQQIASKLGAVMGFLFEETFAEDKITLALTFDNVEQAVKIANLFMKNATISSILTANTDNKTLTLPKLSAEEKAAINAIFTELNTLFDKDAEKNIGKYTIDDLFFLNENDYAYTEVAEDDEFDSTETYYTKGTDETYTKCEGLTAFAEDTTYYTAAANGFIDVKNVDTFVNNLVTVVSALAPLIEAAGYSNAIPVDLTNTKEVKVTLFTILARTLGYEVKSTDASTLEAFEAGKIYVEFYVTGENDETITITSENYQNYNSVPFKTKYTTDATPVAGKLYAKLLNVSFEEVFNLDNIKTLTLNDVTTKVAYLFNQNDEYQADIAEEYGELYVLPYIGYVKEFYDEYVTESEDEKTAYDYIAYIFDAFGLSDMLNIHVKANITAFAEDVTYYTFNTTYNRYDEVAADATFDADTTYYVIASTAADFKTLAEDYTIYDLIGQLIYRMSSEDYQEIEGLTEFEEGIVYYVEVEDYEVFVRNDAEIDTTTKYYKFTPAANLKEFAEGVTYYVLNSGISRFLVVTANDVFDENATYYTKVECEIASIQDFEDGEHYGTKVIGHRATTDTTPVEGTKYYAMIKDTPLTGTQIFTLIEEYTGKICEYLDEMLDMSIVTNNKAQLQAITCSIQNQYITGTFTFDFVTEYTNTLAETLDPLKEYAKAYVEGSTSVIEELIPSDATGDIFSNINSDDKGYALIKNSEEKIIGIKVASIDVTEYYFGDKEVFTSVDRVWSEKEYIGNTYWKVKVSTHCRTYAVNTTPEALDYSKLNYDDILYLYFDTATQKFVNYDSLFEEDTTAAVTTESGLSIKKFVSKMNSNIYYYVVTEATTTTDTTTGA